MPVILEGVVTTLDQQGEVNIAPMGPIVDAPMSRITLRPYRTSRTYQNLKQNGQGVFHVTDDAELIARAAIGQLESTPALRRALAINGLALEDCCRAYEFRVVSLDDSAERTTIECEIVHVERRRDFFGFHRARHAVLEAAILATRVHLLPATDIRKELSRLRIPVDKTAGDAERRAFDMLCNYVEAELAQSKVLDEVRVTTGCRIHLGMLSFGHPCVRQFGGAGFMIASPGWQIAVRRSDALRIGFVNRANETEPLSTGDDIARVERVVRHWQDARKLDVSPPVAIEIQSTLRSHAGLGSGTQLAIAVAVALERLHGRETIGACELAALAGRTNRSSIGAYGFTLGGFIVEAGRLSGELIGPLVNRVEMPDAWRVVLATPRRATGLHGAEEQAAFAKLPPMSASLTNRLSRELMLEMLPALHAADLQAFGASVYRYGRLAGRAFAPAQGGSYASPQVAALVDRLRKLGASGVGQSSWGPTVFVMTGDDASAERIADQLQGDAELDVHVTKPDNSCAVVESIVRPSS